MASGQAGGTHQAAGASGPWALSLSIQPKCRLLFGRVPSALGIWPNPRDKKTSRVHQGSTGQPHFVGVGTMVSLTLFLAQEKEGFTAWV